MYVSVTGASVTLEDPEDTRSFKVVVTEPGTLDQALRGAGWGRLDGNDALIPITAVERAASGRVPADWGDAFEHMLAYARTKGWLSEDGLAIRAHVELNV